MLLLLLLLLLLSAVAVVAVAVVPLVEMTFSLLAEVTACDRSAALPRDPERLLYKRQFPAKKVTDIRNFQSQPKSPHHGVYIKKLTRWPKDALFETSATLHAGAVQY